MSTLLESQPDFYMERMMNFEFKHKHKTVGYLEGIDGQTRGCRLPFHAGITFIGRAEVGCEFQFREKLKGVIESAQIFIRMDEKGCWITDATSSNQTTLIRKQVGKMKTDQPHDFANPDDKYIIKYEKFKTDLEERRWIQVFSGELLSHVYGRWKIIF